ncbi:MAG: response regulator [Rhodospirillaceae bacterium]|nr:response regulator [Rhodospirillaceae bacterium]
MNMTISRDTKILIIDDDEQIREMLRDILEEITGHPIDEAMNGVEGLAAFESNPVDLVITDILMPDMDGIEMIIQMRRKYPDIKIIAISGGGRARQMDFLKIAVKAGALRILPKPFTPKRLLEIVTELLETSTESQV